MSGWTFLFLIVVAYWLGYFTHWILSNTWEDDE